MEKETLGTMLRCARKKSDLSAIEVCDLLQGIDPPELSKLETGKIMPMRKKLESLCSLYGIDLDTALKLVGLEYGLRMPHKAREQKDISDIYKFTAAMSREVASAILEIVQLEGYSSTQGWFADMVKQKIAAGAGTPTTSAEENMSSLL